MTGFLLPLQGKINKANRKIVAGERERERESGVVSVIDTCISPLFN